MRRCVGGEDGVALVIAVMSMMLMTALGSALILTTMTETGVSSNYVSGLETFYAADAAVERTLADLPATEDWSALVGFRADSPLEVLLDRPQASGIRVVRSVAAAEQDGAIVVRAQAYGLLGVERTVEVTVARTAEEGQPGIRLLAWREVR